jgi:hypothetical protein
MDADDIAYKKSVRNMSFVLAAIAITIFAAIFAFPYLSPPADTYQASVSYDSAFGFTLHLQLNATAVAPGGGVAVTGWLNSTSATIDNVTGADSWAIGPASLWSAPCTAGWPIGVGFMQGHYTLDNYTLGRLIPLNLPAAQGCPVQSAVPGYFLLEPHSSKALVDLGGAPEYWLLQSSFTFSASSFGGPQGPGAPGLQAGTYTVVMADEWGDLLTTSFLVS